MHPKQLESYWTLYYANPPPPLGLTNSFVFKAPHCIYMIDQYQIWNSLFFKASVLKLNINKAESCIWKKYRKSTSYTSGNGKMISMNILYVPFLIMSLLGWTQIFAMLILRQARMWVYQYFGKAARLILGLLSAREKNIVLPKFCKELTMFWHQTNCVPNLLNLLTFWFGKKMACNQTDHITTVCLLIHLDVWTWRLVD